MSGFQDFQGFLVSRALVPSRVSPAYCLNRAEHFGLGLQRGIGCGHGLRAAALCPAIPSLAVARRCAGCRVGFPHRCRRHHCARRLDQACHRPVERAGSTIGGPHLRAYSDHLGTDYRLDHRHGYAVYRHLGTAATLAGGAALRRLFMLRPDATVIESENLRRRL
jgi:hypothetical protein